MRLSKEQQLQVLFSDDDWQAIIKQSLTQQRGITEADLAAIIGVHIDTLEDYKIGLQQPDKDVQVKLLLLASNDPALSLALVYQPILDGVACSPLVDKAHNRTCRGRTRSWLNEALPKSAASTILLDNTPGPGRDHLLIHSKRFTRTSNIYMDLMPKRFHSSRFVVSPGGAEFLRRLMCVDFLKDIRSVIAEARKDDQFRGIHDGGLIHNLVYPGATISSYRLLQISGLPDSVFGAVKTLLIQQMRNVATALPYAGMTGHEEALMRVKSAQYKQEEIEQHE